MLGRRAFASRGFGFVFGVVISLTMPGCSFEDVKNKEFKRLLSKENFGTIFDSEVLDELSLRQGRSADQLISVIFQNPLPGTKEEVIGHLRNSAKLDFESGNTIQIDGWIFSRTIAEFAVLQQLL